MIKLNNKSIEVNIPLNKDNDISKCPRCGAIIVREPQPSLHLASTCYECDTEVIEFNDGSEKYINRIGKICINNISKL